jgi:hypothetical protein
MAVGIGMILTWGTLRLAAPRMPESWPFGLVETILMVALLLLTNAWVSLLFPSNWEHVIAKAGFGTTMGVLAWWWTTFLGALILTIALAAKSPGALTVPLGIYV